MELIEFLLGNGIVVDQSDNNGQTPLGFACEVYLFFNFNFLFFFKIKIQVYSNIDNFSGDTFKLSSS